MLETSSKPPDTLEKPDWHRLLLPEIQGFMKTHADDNIPALALKKPPRPDWPYALILDQIKARQKAAGKLPDVFLSSNRVILPPPDLIEQASSQATALYKAGLVGGRNFADLTAGAGVDSWALAQSFKSGICVERDPHTAALLKHNLEALELEHLTVRTCAAEDFMASAEAENLDLAYLDPQRRNTNKRGIFRLEDTAPSVLDVLPALKKNAKAIMLKCSPMLDIDLGIKTLKHVAAVHVLEWQKDCKELVFILQPDQENDPDHIPITAAMLGDNGQPQRALTFTRAQETQADCVIGPPSHYLYDPGPAFHKAGCFRFLAAHFGLQKLHPSTHLYTSANLRPEFPGRIFTIDKITKPQASAFETPQANLAIRNFPVSVPDLRKKLKLADGGENYVFACTASDGQKILIHTQKAV
jgi:hypothetical protein